jgi:hypothetical protein
VLDDGYLVVAAGSSLIVYKFEDSPEIVLKLTTKTETRTQCASLTCPKSEAVVYADKFASVIVYTVIDGRIDEQCRDYNPKGLMFARLESETEVLAIGQDSVVYLLRIDELGTMRTSAAFRIGCELSAVLNAPDLAFLSKDGSLSVIMRCDIDLRRIFDVMKGRLRGIAGLTLDDYRKVIRNGKAYPFGNFVDGDLLKLFFELNKDEKGLISRGVGKSVEEIERLLGVFCTRLEEYRRKVQVSPRF